MKLQPRDIEAAHFVAESYRAVYAENELRFVNADGATIARLSGYDVRCGSVHNLRRPISGDDGWITLDTAEGLAAGAAVEIRNEYQYNRANRPLSHQCRILEVSGDRVRVDRLPNEQPLRERQGAFIVNAQSFAARNWDLRVLEDDGVRATWRLDATAGPVDVAILAVLRRDDPRVELRPVRRFKKTVRVFNESVRLTDLPPLSEVYRKNRQIDQEPFQRRYVIDREGASFRGGDRRELFFYRDTDATSVTIEAPNSAFRLRAVTPSTAERRDLDGALRGELLRYASVPAYDGVATFEAVFDAPITVHGLRILWYRHRHPQRLRVFSDSAADGWVLATESVVDATPVGTYVFGQAVMTRRIRVEIDCGPNTGAHLHSVDFLISGNDFDAVFNLDDHRDHRYSRYLDPRLRRPDMGNMTVEMRSAAARTSGEHANGYCAFRVGDTPPIRPRIMHIPGGAQSMLIWTEHADRTTLESHRAAYFGRSTVRRAADAVGGFVKYGVLVTKSVFYENPEQRVCSITHPVPQVAVSDNAEFGAFCDELAQLGYEICVHAPQPVNAPPQAGPAAAAYFAKRFGSRTWIDHSARVVHCGMSGQGLNETSPYFMGNAWGASGVRYFWQFASEDTSCQLVGSINVQQTRVGDWLHTPLFWNHPTETRDYVTWPAVRGGGLEPYSDAAIDELVADWGVSITHTYPAAHWDDATRNPFITGRNDGFVTTGEFEDVLRRLARRLSAGTMVSSTAGAAVAYWEASEATRIVYTQSGDTFIINFADAIPGFTFVLRGFEDVHAGTPGIVVRRVGHDAMVTLDLPSRSVVRVDSDGSRVACRVSCERGTAEAWTLAPD